eukprot:1149655-Pelagomonas_calceolata.AAC.1
MPAGIAYVLRSQIWACNLLAQQMPGKVVLLDKLFDSESTSCEWSQRCISRNIQIDCFVTHHADIFQSICVGELHTIKVSFQTLTLILSLTDGFFEQNQYLTGPTTPKPLHFLYICLFGAADKQPFYTSSFGLALSTFLELALLPSGQYISFPHLFLYGQASSQAC